MLEDLLLARFFPPINLPRCSGRRRSNVATSSLFERFDKAIHYCFMVFFFKELCFFWCSPDSPGCLGVFKEAHRSTAPSQRPKAGHFAGRSYGQKAQAEGRKGKVFVFFCFDSFLVSFVFFLHSGWALFFFFILVGLCFFLILILFLFGLCFFFAF